MLHSTAQHLFGQIIVSLRHTLWLNLASTTLYTVSLDEVMTMLVNFKMLSEEMAVAKHSRINHPHSHAITLLGSFSGIVPSG